MEKLFKNRLCLHWCLKRNLNFKGQEITFIYADIEFQNLYAENQLSDM